MFFALEGDLDYGMGSEARRLCIHDMSTVRVSKTLNKVTLAPRPHGGAAPGDM